MKVCVIFGQSQHILKKKNTSTKCDDMTEVRALFAGSDQNDCDFGKKNYCFYLVKASRILNRKCIIHEELVLF